jgi:hypothetical protein
MQLAVGQRACARSEGARERIDLLEPLFGFEVVEVF